jgi:hypothetical protein
LKTLPGTTAEAIVAGLGLAACLWFGGGCVKSSVDRALGSDARGYFCPGCNAKFYTEFDVIADVCPHCKTNAIREVVGFVCSIDQHATLAPRGRGAVPCEQCGKPASKLSLPREAELKAWNAVRRTKAEVAP